jgi:hypothetical protein
MSTYFDLHGFQDVKNNILVEYLNPLDVILHKDTFGLDYIKKVIIYRIEYKLKLIFQDDYTKFRTILNNDNIVISGSFLIQVILGCDWEHSDIDMFTDLKVDRNYMNILRLDYTSNIIFEDKDITDTYGYFKEKFKCLNGGNVGISDSFEYFNNLKIHDILDYKYHNKKLQITCIDPEALYSQNVEVNKETFISSINEYIKKDFDFDICTNIFYRYNGKSHLILNCLDGIIKNEIKIINDMYRHKFRLCRNFKCRQVHRT